MAPILAAVTRKRNTIPIIVSNLLFAYTPLTLHSLAQFVRDIAELNGKSVSPRERQLHPARFPNIRRRIGGLRRAISYCSAHIWSFLNGQFDVPKQNPQRSSNELRLFEPGKLGKSFQYLTVGLRQPDRGLLQVA